MSIDELFVFLLPKQVVSAYMWIFFTSQIRCHSNLFICRHIYSNKKYLCCSILVFGILQYTSSYQWSTTDISYWCLQNLFYFGYHTWHTESILGCNYMFNVMAINQSFEKFTVCRIRMTVTLNDLNSMAAVLITNKWP